MTVVRAVTREDVAHIVGPAVAESVILEIIRTGATKEELEEAFAWVNANDEMTREGRHQPHGLVAELCDILQRPEIEINRD
jgi:hypothetical protein